MTNDDDADYGGNGDNGDDGSGDVVDRCLNGGRR